MRAWSSTDDPYFLIKGLTTLGLKAAMKAWSSTDDPYFLINGLTTPGLKGSNESLVFDR